MRLTHAKYASVCRVCGQNINKGDKLAYRPLQSPRGRAPVERAVHERCLTAEIGSAPVPTETVPPPNSGNPLVDAVQQIVDMRLSSRMEEVDARIQEHLEQLPSGPGGPAITVTVAPPLTPVATVTGARRANHAEILELVGAGEPVLLCGPTGSGKSTLAKHLAEDLGLRYDELSCTEVMSETKIVGRNEPGRTGAFEFRDTPFIDFYMNGGLYLLDEVDASNPNVLICIHSAIANGHLSCPQRYENTRLSKHPTFRLVTSANTWGTGADRMYVGRNQLDAATLDRVALGQFMVDYDTTLEQQLIQWTELHVWAAKVREAINSHNLRRVLSTRTLLTANKMHIGPSAWTLTRVKAQYFAPWTKEEKAIVGEGREGFYE